MSSQFIASQFAILPMGIHARTGVDTLVTLTPPNLASIIIIQAEGQPIRYTISSNNPTASFGFRLLPADGERRIDMYQGMRIRIIGEAAGGFVNYQWCRIV